jgi:hypothetical protein
MNRLHIAALIPAAAILFFASGASAAGLAVDLKFEETRAVSVPLGADNGVTAESDFLVAIDNEHKVAVIPSEIFPKRFWSAPLAPEEFSAIRTGMAVERYAPDKMTHQLLRRIAAEYSKQIKMEQFANKQWEQRKKLGDLRERRAKLLNEKEKIEGWIAETDRTIADAQLRSDQRSDSAEQDTARAQQRLDDYTDRRNELQSRRDALPRSDSAARDRLTEQISALNGRIASERDTIRAAQERLRDAKASLRVDVRDKRKLQADRDAIVLEMKTIDREIADLEK